MEFPKYQRLKKEVQIATRSDKARIVAIASSGLGLVIQVVTSAKRSEEILLDSFLNHTPAGSLKWDEKKWAEVERFN